MWTSTLHLEPKRVLLTKLLGLLYPDIYYSSLSPLQVQNVARQPLPSRSWVRVRNRLAGICGSDLHLIFADADLRIAPAALPGHRHLYPGHEVVGEVIEIGDDVQDLQVGDRVVLQNSPNCLSTGIYSPCRSCAAGNYNLCEEGVLPGPQPIGGGWSEEMLLHEQQLFRLPNKLSDEQGVLLEPTAVAVHAVLRHLPQHGERVLIIGAGTIGLLTLQVIRALVPQAKVSMLARHAPQREQAKRMGATYLIHPTDSYGEMQQVTEAQLYRGIFGNRTLLGGYDVIYDTVGHRNTLYHALRWARAQATIVLIGVSLHMMHIDLTPIWHQQINLLGSTSHGMETWPPQTKQQYSTFSIAADLMAQDRIHPEQLITHRFALNNYKDALITATRKARTHAIKVVFDYSLQPASVVPNSKAGTRTPLPLPISRDVPKTSQKLVHVTPYDNAKDTLRQLRLSLRRGGEFSSTTSPLLLPSREDRSDIEAVQTLQVFGIHEEHPLATIESVAAPADQHEAFLTLAETIPEIVDSDQTAMDTIKVQESVAHDILGTSAEIVAHDILDASVEIIAHDILGTSAEIVAHDMLDASVEIVAHDMLNVSIGIIASVQEEQAAPMAEIPPKLTTLDEHPTSKVETALAPMELIASQEDLQPTMEMAQLIPAEDRQTTDNGSTSTVDAVEMNGTKDATKVFSFPAVEDTPTVRVRSKRDSRKRRTKSSQN